MPDPIPPARPTHSPPVPQLDLGVLFVHGIGDQKHGATLFDFGHPLVDWLSKRAEQLGASVTVTETLGTQAGSQVGREDDTPARTVLRIDTKHDSRRWMLAESWWAESFAVRPFRELASWSFAVIPWTFGAHFGRRLLRAVRKPRAGRWAAVAWAIGVIGASAALLGGVVLSIGMLGVFSALMLLGLIPWPRLRSAIQTVQVRLSSSLGDSFVLVSRPIESAAIVSVFRNNLEWMTDRCRRVVVVAHSQGAAVAVLGLAGDVARRPELLVTFGSGYRKLEELALLRRNKTLRSGAAYTLAGLVMVLWMILVAGRAWASPPTAFKIDDLVLFLTYTIVGFTLLGAGLKDFVRGPEPPRIKQQARSFANTGLRWKDIFASADPVPNGRLHDDESLLPETIEVVNRSSMFEDHTTYWANSDEFVALVTDALLESDDPPVLPRLGADTISGLQHRRRTRVSLLRISAFVRNASLVLLFARYPKDWLAVIAWSATKGADWIAGLFNRQVTVADFPTPGTWARAAGWFFAILLVGAIARWLWSVYDRAETEQPPPFQYSGSLVTVFTLAFGVQVGFAYAALRHDPGVSGTVLLALVAGFVLVLFAGLTPGKPRSERIREEREQLAVASSPERAMAFFYRVRGVVLIPFGLYALGHDATQWTQGVLTSVFGTAYSGWWLSFAVTAAGLMLAIMAVVALVFYVVRRKKTAPASTDPG